VQKQRHWSASVPTDIDQIAAEHAGFWEERIQPTDQWFLNRLLGGAAITWPSMEQAVSV
jgi:hypothetical protein